MKRTDLAPSYASGRAGSDSNDPAVPIAVAELPVAETAATPGFSDVPLADILTLDELAARLKPRVHACVLVPTRDRHGHLLPEGALTCATRDWLRPLAGGTLRFLGDGDWQADRLHAEDIHAVHVFLRRDLNAQHVQAFVDCIAWIAVRGDQIAVGVVLDDRFFLVVVPHPDDHAGTVACRDGHPPVPPRLRVAAEDWDSLVPSLMGGGAR